MGYDHNSLGLKVKVIGQGQCNEMCVLQEYLLWRSIGID